MAPPQLARMGDVQVDILSQIAMHFTSPGLELLQIYCNKKVWLFANHDPSDIKDNTEYPQTWAKVTNVSIVSQTCELYTTGHF